MVKKILANIKAKLKARPYLLKIISNISWLVFDKLFRMGAGLFVTVWITRYLGPEQFGVLSFIQALMAFLVTFTTFGLNSIAVKNITLSPQKTNEILGGVFIIQLTLACIAFSVLISLSLLLFDNNLLKITTFILGLSIFLKPFDAIRYYFEAKTQSKYIVWAENSSFIICSFFKIIFILNHASFINIVWLFLLDICLATLFLIIYYQKTQTIFNWKINFQEIKQNLKDCWPLFFAGISIILYMRIDQIMLAQMLNYDAVGIYTAATRISEVWYFIPMVIVASVNPTLMELKLTNKEKYYNKLQLITCVLIALSLSIAILITFSSSWIIKILYGAQYKTADTVLIIHIWTGVFVSLGCIGNQWLIAKGLYSFHLYRSLSGAIINIIFNFLLIPYSGIIGAAIATLIAQTGSALLFDLFNYKTRPLFWLKLRSFNIFYIFKLFSKNKLC